MGDTEHDQARPVLRGWSLWQWGRFTLWTAFAIVPLSFLLGGTIIATESWVSNPVVSSLLIVLGVAFLAGIVGNIMVRVVRDKEFAAGYTTSRGGFLQYDQVDESTGLVVREAGEPALTRAEYRAKIAAFHAAQTERK
ncbi:hypothetical protein [Cryobacterium soli]|uniref:hypothetical protein n=1 Tax=Cryobacterium soli TaxID=2220095 RepID=UPI000E71263E|nr:hypothetical protein [Cryobacterium soli]